MANPLLAVAGNAIGNIGSSLIQNAIGQKNEERQWNRYYSPRAQVQNMAAAGINPAVAFGNQSPVLSSGGQMQMPEVPALGLGTTALAEIGQYINAKATAAKTEKETGKVDAETKKLLSELDAQNLQNDLVRQFGNQKWTYDVAQAYENVLLAKKTNDIKEQEKALNEYHKVTAYLESNLKGSELEMVKKRLGNLDTEIDLSNKLQTEKIATEKSAQTSNYASANASNTQAAVNRENRRFQAALADVEETSSVYKAKSLISEYKSKGMISDADWQEARNRLDNLEDVAHRKKGSTFFNEVDAFSDWLKSKIKIFK